MSAGKEGSSMNHLFRGGIDMTQQAPSREPATALQTITR